MAWSGDRRDIERHTRSQASYKIAMSPTLLVLKCLMGTSPQGMTPDNWTEVATFGTFGEDRAGCHRARRMYLVAVRHWQCLPANQHLLSPRSPSGRHDPHFLITFSSVKHGSSHVTLELCRRSTQSAVRFYLRPAFVIESDDPSYKQTHQGPCSASGTSQDRAVNGAETCRRPKSTIRRLQTRVDHPCHVTVHAKSCLTPIWTTHPSHVRSIVNPLGAQVELVTAEGRDCELSRRVGKSRFGSRAGR